MEVSRWRTGFATTCTRQTWSREGARVNALCPGFVYTNLTKALTDKPESRKFLALPSNVPTAQTGKMKSDLDVAELRLIPAGDPPLRRTVEQIVEPYPVVVAANASFFDKEGRAMGLAVDEGRVMVLSNRRNWGALVIDGTQGRIMLGADIRAPFDHRFIVQGIPRLLVGGKVQQLKPQIAERTAVCAGGNIVVLVVSTKVDATAFARFLADPPDRGGLGCRDALSMEARRCSSW